MTKSGSPTHPSYPGGHATSAGACTTILKIWLDPHATRCWPGYIVEADRSGLNLKNYTGPEFEGAPIPNDKKENCLTVTGELNKLAHNVAMGRDFSGVHWRVDDVNGIRLGEKVAIHYMQNELDRQPECASRKFKSFDGDFVYITKSGCDPEYESIL
uniref:Phosphatidic acid phosphatase type 2/haloperoxidase domain-containing protein n=1 Tax=Ditylum brightwellii TaxID=49249 RepID=A0A7S4QKK9_9STRA